MAGDAIVTMNTTMAVRRPVTMVAKRTEICMALEMQKVKWKHGCPVTTHNWQASVTYGRSFVKENVGEAHPTVCACAFVVNMCTVRDGSDSAQHENVKWKYKKKMMKPKNAKCKV